MLIMNISPEIISLIEEIRNDKTHGASQLARQAAEILGVREVIFLRHPDQSLEDSPEFKKEIVRLIRTYRPAHCGVKSVSYFSIQESR